ncbi:hypothetical protein D3C83_66310 [compost metagenome]
MLTSRSPAESRVTSRSPIHSRPSLGCSRPAISRNSVVLPQPDGPSSVTSVPGAMTRSSGLTAVTGP